ncbi:MAG TPA: hypothetical protein VE198_21570 [Actinoallomurus sp.]|nr:hypothetical protein [Actinoallomurus sp.]
MIGQVHPQDAAVLDVRPGDADTPDLVLLRELAPTAEHTPPGGRLALTKLEEALKSVHPHEDRPPPGADRPAGRADRRLNATPVPATYAARWVHVLGVTA